MTSLHRNNLCPAKEEEICFYGAKINIQKNSYSCVQKKSFFCLFFAGTVGTGAVGNHLLHDQLLYLRVCAWTRSSTLAAVRVCQLERCRVQTSGLCQDIWRLSQHLCEGEHFIVCSPPSRRPTHQVPAETC